VLGETRFPVFASGGVGGVADLVALRGLVVLDRRLAGVIVGRAFAAGELDVAEAVATCAV
jgi:phosphoribosylformimino-5-aminoimidazole carboxamide ribonucleotide (ProFAR) isomerase